MHLLLAGDSQEVRDMIFRDVQRTTLHSFFRSIRDLRDTDLRSQLPALNMPALGIFGARDNIVSPRNGEYLSQGISGAEVVLMAKSRHFPMSDEPDKFLKAVTHFLGHNDLQRESISWK
jgi:pimeloyl-ACP methyl ester carboxylesterase